LGVLSALLHRREGIPALELPGKLKGVLLISPWVCFTPLEPGFGENADEDIMTLQMQGELRDEWVAPADLDAFSEPASAVPEWWSGSRTESVLLLIGELEIFRDNLVAFGTSLESAGDSVSVIMCPRQVHTECILDSHTGLDHGRMSEAVWKWLETRLQ
jgi:acetyl esterase/lipase